MFPSEFVQLLLDSKTSSLHTNLKVSAHGVAMETRDVSLKLTIYV